jgi:hypothetical protein
MVVESIGFTEVNGESRRTIYFEPYQGWFRDEFWIEGIGSNFGLFSRGMFGPDFDPWAKCMKENQMVVYNFDPTVNDCDYTFTDEDCNLLSGVFDVKKNDFATSISPNPLQEKTTISFAGKTMSNAILTVFNLNGQLLKQQFFSGNRVVLERGDLPAGLFILKIQNDLGEISTGKILIK